MSHETLTLSTTEPVARKDYTCEVCNGAIRRGVRHVVCTGIYEGDFHSSRLHSNCHQDCLDYASHMDYGESYTFEAVREWVQDGSR